MRLRAIIPMSGFRYEVLEMLTQDEPLKRSNVGLVSTLWSQLQNLAKWDNLSSELIYRGLELIPVSQGQLTLVEQVR